MGKLILLDVGEYLMGKNNNEEEYVYSYIHKRMISTSELNGEPRKRKNSPNGLFKMIVLVAMVSGAIFLIKENYINLDMFKSKAMDITLQGQDQNKNEITIKDEMSEFIQYGDSILKDTLGMINYAVGEYNKNNFSQEVITRFENDIKILNSYDLSKYSSKRYEKYRAPIEKTVGDSKKILEFLLIAKKNTADNSKILRAYIEDGNKTRQESNIKVEEMLRDNGYRIEKLEDGTIRYYRNM